MLPDDFVFQGKIFAIAIVPKRHLAKKSAILPSGRARETLMTL
jgi:hypothetical protein